MNRTNTVVACFVCAMIMSCKDEGVMFNRGNNCPPYTKVAPSPYSTPVWHPAGAIGFNYTPLRRITYPNGEACEGFYQFITDSTGFWLMNSNGSNVRMIFPDTLSDPAWSWNGDWIAFVRGPVTSQICKMQFNGFEFDTSTIVQLTQDGNNLSPVWSPDGQWIAFESDVGGSNGEFAIWKMRSDGTQKRRLSQAGVGEERHPHWSPDGRSIVHERKLPGGIVEIFVSDTSGTSSQRLTLDQRMNTFPRYSPNGAQISFLSRSLTGANNDLIRINSDGSAFPLTIASGVSFPASWSPPGGLICYTSYRLRDYSYRNGTLWVANLNTGMNTQVTFNVERP
jgi:Tol biopolymer transport system component